LGIARISENINDMKLQKIVYILLTALALNACNVVEKVYFETLNPADTIIDLTIQKIDIVNRFAIDRYSEKIDEPNKWALDSLVSFECIKALYGEIKQGERFSPQRVDTVFRWEESANPRIELTNVDLSVKTLLDPVRDFATGYYRAAVRVDYRVSWKVFADEKREVYSRQYIDTVWLEGLKPYFTQLYDLVEFDRAIEHIVQKTARNFAAEISPTWKPTYRYLFTTGHNDFVVAAYYVSQGEWEKAESLWLKHASGGNRSLAGKANYNLAVKAEKEGKLLVALEYAQKSAKENRFNYAQDYIKILRIRLNNIKVIESQLP